MSFSPSFAFKARIAIGSVFFSAVLFPHLYEPGLSYVWNALCENSFYRSSVFETVWTVLCYAVIEPWFTITFLNRPDWRFHEPKKAAHDGKIKLSVRGMRRPSRRLVEIFTYIVPLLVMDLTMVKKFADVPLEDILISGNYDPSGFAEEGRGGHRKTFLIPSLHNTTVSSPFQTVRALPALPPSSRRLALEIVASFFIYDSLFFLFHLALHTVPLLRRYHAPHHRHDIQINPQVTNQLHITERLGLVLLANFSLNVIGSHVLTRTVFVPVFVWLLVEIHSGMDLPWGYEKILPKGWAGGARKHAAHHRNGDGGLEPFFEWWDGFADMVKCWLKRPGSAVSSL